MVGVLGRVIKTAFSRLEEEFAEKFSWRNLVFLSYRTASHKTRHSSETYWQGCQNCTVESGEHFENKKVFWRKSCFLFTFWTWSELSFCILAEFFSGFVEIAFLSRVERKGKKTFFRNSLFFFKFWFSREKIYDFWCVSDNLWKLHSVCSRSRFEGSIISAGNPIFLSFSGFNEKTSN